MANPALGTKRHCPSCNKNYYDLKKSPIICPHCQAEFDPEILLKSRNSKPVIAQSEKKTQAANDEVIDDALGDADLEGDEEGVAADDDIIDDGDDINVVTSPSDGGDEGEDSNDAINTNINTDDAI